MRKLLLCFCLIATVCAINFQVSEDVVKRLNPKIRSLVPIQALNNLNKEYLKEFAFQLKTLPESGTEAIINEYADKIFANVQNLIVHDGLDPFQMPDIHEGFNYTLIITYHGELDLTNGWLYDLSTLHRGDDVVVTYSTQDKYLQVTVPIAFDDLQFEYDFSAKIMGLGPKGNLDGKIKNLSVQAKIGFNADTLLFSLDEFYIIHSGDIDVEFHGEPLVDWLFDLLSDLVTKVLKEAVLLIVEDIVGGGLQSVIDAINEAINGFINPTTVAPTSTTATAFNFK